MDTKPRFGIIRSIGVGGRVYIEGIGLLSSVWLFADTINFDSFRARNSRCECGNEIGNALVFSGVSDDKSWRGVDTNCADHPVVSRIAAIVDIVGGFSFPPAPALFRARHFNLSLVEAAKNRNLSLVEQLLEAGSDPNSVDTKGNSALLYAVATNNYDLVVLLSSYGANSEQPNQNQVYPLGLAKEQKKSDLIAPLSKARVQYDRANRLQSHCQAPCN